MIVVEKTEAKLEESRVCQDLLGDDSRLDDSFISIENLEVKDVTLLPSRESMVTEEHFDMNVNTMPLPSRTRKNLADFVLCPQKIAKKD